MDDSIDWARTIMWTKWQKTNLFRLILNLRLQPQPNPNLWIRQCRDNSVKFCELKKIQELNEIMEQICMKIASGYCQRYEIENEGLKIIPLPIKNIIGRVYLFEEPSLFKVENDDDKSMEWQSEYEYQDLLKSAPKPSIYEIVD